MRGLVLEGVEHVAVEDVPDPGPLAPTDAEVQVSVAGLCGSDLHPYLGREPARMGVVQGHEAVGTVVAVGNEVRSFAIGDRVIVPFTTSCGSCGPCRRGLSSRCVDGRLFGWGDPLGDAPPLHGAQAERLLVPLADGTLVGAPPGIDDTTAVLLSDNLPTAWHAVHRAEWSDGALAVIGLGSVGQLAVAVALATGTGPVLAVDPVRARRAAAATQSGRVTALAPEEIGSFDTPITAVVEAAGPMAAQQMAGRIAAPGSTISIIAVQTGDRFGIDPVTAYDRNLTVRVGRAPVRSVLPSVLDRVLDGSLTVPTGVVTHPDLPLDDGPAAYRAFADRTIGKATFRP